MDLNLNANSVTLVILAWLVVNLLRLRLAARALRLQETRQTREARGGGVL